MPVKAILRDALFWTFLVLYGIAFLAMGSTLDTDNAAQKDIGTSVYLLWATIVSSLSLAPVTPLLYGGLAAGAATYYVRTRQWALAIFFANPFVLANLCDVFNRFTLTLVLATLAAYFLHRGRAGLSFLSGAAFATAHPMNVVFLGYAVSPVLAIAAPLSVSLAQTFLSLDVITYLFADKVELMRQFGDNIALSAGGNFQIDPNLYIDGNGFFWFLAAALPGLFTTNEGTWVYAMAAYMAVWYVTIFAFVRAKLVCALLALACIGTLALFVGNSAVIMRHFLPLFYFALLLFSDRPNGLQPWIGVLDLIRTKTRTGRVLFGRGIS